MNNDRLAHLRAKKAGLEADLTALAERLARCDSAIEAMDAALAERDQLLEEHDRAVADSIVHRKPAPEMNPRLNLSEIALRRASGEARAATRARAGIIDQQADINFQLSQVIGEFDEALWAAVPAACAALFGSAEEGQRQFEHHEAAIDGVARYALTLAHQQANPERTPAYGCYLRLRAMVEILDSKERTSRLPRCDRRLLRPKRY
jgi:hypothetical protein